MSASDSDQGLYGKYDVRKDGEPVAECFVLEPTDDPSARAALATYAATTDDDALAEDLRAWLAAYDGSEHEGEDQGGDHA